MVGEDSPARADPWRHIRALAPPPQGECRERPQAIGPWSTSDAWVPGLLPERAPADGAAPRRSRGTWAANHGLGFRWNLRVM